jgi:DNA topoisomerase-3
MTAFNSREGGFFLTTVGRVQTPTLSIMVEREEQIRRHVSRDYWEVRATFAVGAGEYEGKWFDPTWKKRPDPDGAAAPDPELRADRLWTEADANAIAQAVQGEPARVSEEARPSTQAPPLLYDLTSLQREANSRFGFSARTTLSLAQALYEKHKVLTYPRTDSRALPEDYVEVARQTAQMIAGETLPGPLRPLAAHAATALKEGYIRPAKRIFDNAKVSDHFAIIPTLQAPKSLSEIEAKLYDMIAKRFLAVFFPSAEFLVTTRISTVEKGGNAWSFQTNGKVMVRPGWLAVYGREAQEDDASLVAVAEGELARTESVDVKALKTRPPARYTEATLLSAMEGAGKLIEDDELREAMQEKGLGTPATRAAIIEGLIYEKYIHREGRELVPGAKAFQLMTLLRGPRRRGPDQARADRQLGAPAGGDGEGPPRARHLHEEHRGDGRAHRQEGQGVRPRHDPGRLRDARNAVPELRRHRQGELPPLRLRRDARRLARRRSATRGLRLLDQQDPGRAPLRAGRGRGLPARPAHRPARRLPLEGGLAVHGRAEAGP